MSTEERQPKKHTFLIIVGVLAIIAACIFGTIKFVSCLQNPDNNDNSLLNRVATNNDIYIDLSEEVSLSMNYKVTPKVDISNLQLTFDFYDNNNNIISTKIKSVGNVSKDVTTSVTITLSEFSFVEIFKIVKVSAKVTGGTVSYFA